jgi:hypothetical protein
MGNVVSLHAFPIPLAEDEKFEFIEDMTRFSSGIVSEAFVRRKYRFDEKTWNKLGDDETLIELIENRKLERIRNGRQAAEKAQIHYADVGDVLGKILKDDGASPRHRIESAKELRAVSAVGPEAAPSGDRFIISIRIGNDVETYNKSVTINADDVDPTERRDDGSGEPV